VRRDPHSDPIFGRCMCCGCTWFESATPVSLRIVKGGEGEKLPHDEPEPGRHT
jgi:hypothetical protein